MVAPRGVVNINEALFRQKSSTRLVWLLMLEKYVLAGARTAVAASHLRKLFDRHVKMQMAIVRSGQPEGGGQVWPKAASLSLRKRNWPAVVGLRGGG